MKKRINGMTYDTDTAHAIASYSNGQPESTIIHLSETLYHTESGEYFLHGKGGALTCYAKVYQSRCNRAGEVIIPMSEDRAIAWAKDYTNRGASIHISEGWLKYLGWEEIKT